MTVRARFCLAVALTAIVAVATGGVARAVVLRPHWRLKVAWLVTVGPKVPSLAADSRYVAFLTWRGFGASLPQNPKIVLIDKRTRKQLALSSGCAGLPAGGLAFGGPWLMCSTVSTWLYSLRSGRWVNVSAQCPGGFSGVVAVGTYWVKCFGVSRTAVSVIELVNIETGNAIADPATSGGSFYDDLNSPSGQQPLCAPLRYPQSAPFSSVTFYGRFALVTDGTVAYLRACHSRLNVQLGAPPSSVWAASTNAVIWSTAPSPSGPYSLQGLFLPSLRHFTVRLPGDLAAGISTIAVSRRTLYVESNTRHLWTTELPAPR